MSAIIIDDSLTPLLKQINTLSPAGEDARYRPCYEIMESEVKKFGSLFGESVDWKTVQCSTTEVLCQHSKDLKAACYLAQAMFNLSGVEGLNQGLTALLELISRFGNSLYPQRKRGRDGAFEWLDHQLEITLLKMDTQALSSTSPSLNALTQCQRLITHIQRAANDVFQPSKKTLTTAYSALGLLIEQTKASSNRSTDTPFTPKLPKKIIPNKLTGIDIETDFSSPMASKLTLKKVAETLFRTDPSAPISYRLYRHLTWLHIDKLPEDQNKITALNLAVSQDQITDYQEKIKQGADISFLKRLEQILTDSPFWFTGQHLVYLWLVELGHHLAADAVAQETSRFVCSLPGIENFLFANSFPFADQATQQWLAATLDQAAKGNHLAQQMGDPIAEQEDFEPDFSSQFDAENINFTGDNFTGINFIGGNFDNLALENLAIENLEIKNIGEHLITIEKHLNIEPGERGQFLLHLQLITIFLDLKLYFIALPYLEKIWAISDEMKLKRWEPSLFSKLTALAKTALSTLYPTKKQLPLKYQQWQSIYTKKRK